jgi:uncharacterized protein (DUF433 family)
LPAPHLFALFNHLEPGKTHEELLRDFPDLTEEDIRACLAFAADREKNIEILVE